MPEDLVDKDPIKADEIHSSIVNGNLTIVLGHLKEFQPVDSNHSGFWPIESGHNPVVFKNDLNIWTALDDAAFNGQIDIVEAISSNLLDINPRMNVNTFNAGSAIKTDTFGNGFTPLHHAAMQGHLEVVQYFTKCLIEKNPSIDSGKHVMYWAAEKQQLEIVKHYLDILPDGKKNPKANAIDDNYKGRTPLHATAENGNLEIMKAINAHLIDINPGDAHGFTPLHLASKYGHLHIVRYLIDQIKDIDPAADDFYSGETPYFHAAFEGHLDIVELYLQRLPMHEINSGLISTNPVYQGRTPLHAAAQNGYLNIVKAISKHLTNLSPKNALGTTPLILAVENGHLAIVKYFVENLKDINPAGGEFYKNKTPFYEAAEFNQLDIIKYYLEKLPETNKNPSINSSDIEFQGRTALHAAAEFGHLEIVKAITEYNLTDINPGDAHGYTPLHLAAQRGHIEVVKYLISRLEDINPAANDGLHHSVTPFYTAAENNQLSIVEYYLEMLPIENKNPKLNSSDDLYNGQTPLHAASLNGDLQMIKIIMNKLLICPCPLYEVCTLSPPYGGNQSEPITIPCYDTNPGDGHKYTPLHLAAYYGYLDVVQFFVESGLEEVNPAADEFYYNQTPLHLAAANNHINVVKYLSEKVDNLIIIEDTFGRTPYDLALEVGQTDTDLLAFLQPS